MILSMVSCTPKRLLLISDPVFERIINTSQVSRQLKSAARSQGYRLETSEFTQLEDSRLKEGGYEALFLTPDTSAAYLGQRDPQLRRFVQEKRAEGIAIGLWVTENDFSKLSETLDSEGDIFLTYDRLSGWRQAIDLLEQTQIEGRQLAIYSQAEQEELIELFPAALLEDAHILTVPEGAANLTTAKVQRDLEGFEQAGVKVICIMIEQIAPKILSQLENSDMLCIIEHGQYMPVYAPRLFCSIEIDYEATFQKAFSMIAEQSEEPVEVVLHCVLPDEY